MPRRINQFFIQCPKGFVPDTSAFKVSDIDMNQRLSNIPNKWYGNDNGNEYYSLISIDASIKVRKKNGSIKTFGRKMPTIDSVKMPLIIDYFDAQLYKSIVNENLSLREINEVYAQPFFDNKVKNIQSNYKTTHIKNIEEFGKYGKPVNWWISGKNTVYFLKNADNKKVFIAHDAVGNNWQIIDNKRFVTNMALQTSANSYSCTNSHLRHRNVSTFLIPYKNDDNLLIEKPNLLIFVRDIMYKLQNESPILEETPKIDSIKPRY